jgi:transglutaminase-like putative cysteine protease
MLAEMSLRRIPDGVDGIRVTLQRMAVIARAAVRDEQFLILVRDITRGLPPADKLAEATTIFEWAMRHIRYVKDPVGVELIMPPNRLVQLGAGDCDDLSIFMVSALESLGICARFVAIQTRPNAGYNHVYPQGWINNRWVSFDLASPSPTVDVALPSVVEPILQYISLESSQLGLGATSDVSWTPTIVFVAGAIILFFLLR